MVLIAVWSALVLLATVKLSRRADKRDALNESLQNVVLNVRTIKATYPADGERAQELSKHITALWVQTENRYGCLCRTTEQREEAREHFRFIERHAVFTANLIRTERYKLNPKLPDPDEAWHDVEQKLDELVELARQ